MAKRDRGLYRRGQIWWICYKGVDGRIYRESSHSRSMVEAQRLLQERRHAVLTGQHVPRRRVAFAELAEEYLAWAKRQKSFPTKRGLIRQLLQAFGNRPLETFTIQRVEAYQTQLLQRGLTPATVNRHLATLKHMFTKAVEWEMVDEAVLRRVRRVKQLPEHNQRLRYLSQEEITRLLGACADHLYPIVVVALHTGMRKREILSLRWDQVDFRHGLLLLEKTKNGLRREIPMNTVVRETLQQLPRRLDSPYVFTNEAGKPFRDVKRSFITACRRAGIRDLRFHDLRHTFASHLVMAGADLPTVKQLLGHQTLTMTLRYAHLAPTHTAQAVENLAARISTSQLLHNRVGSGMERSG